MKNKNYIAVLTGFLLLAATITSYAQLTWQKGYGIQNPRVRAVTPTLDGGCLMAGYIKINPSDYNPIVLLVKIKANGDTAWTRTYANTGDIVDDAGGIAQLSTGHYITSGASSVSNGLGTLKLLAQRIDSNGNVIWNKSYQAANGTFQGDGICRIAGDSTLHFGTHHLPTGNAHGAVTLMDANGTVAWSKSYSYTTAFVNVLSWQGIKMPNGTIYVSGTTVNAGSYASVDKFLMKLNAAGNVIWLKTYSTVGSIGSSHQQDVMATADGNLLFTYGVKSSPGFIVHKLDTAGNIIWAKKIMGQGASGTANAAAFLAGDGGYIVFGSSNGDIFNNNEDAPCNAWLVKLKANGDTAWTKSYGNNLAPYIISRGTRSNDGGFIFAGRTIGTDTRMYAMKTDSNGNNGCLKAPQVFVVSTPVVTVTPQTVTQQSLSLTVTNNTVVKSHSPGMETLCTVTGISAPDAMNTVSFSIFPNPASIEITLQYDLAEAAKVSLRIYNTMGTQAVTILSNEQKTAGIHRHTMDVTHLNKGIYFCEIIANGHRVTKKLIVQ